jgi:hypothetical protein
MSSAPAGLDVKEYGYFCFRYLVPDGQEHLVQCGSRWNVTRIQFFAPVADFPPPGNGYIILNGSTQIFLENQGCVDLEPNGAFRNDILVFGEGALLLVEAWFQPASDGVPPTVTVTP